MVTDLLLWSLGAPSLEDMALNPKRGVFNNFYWLYHAASYAFLRPADLALPRLILASSWSCNLCSIEVSRIRQLIEGWVADLILAGFCHPSQPVSDSTLTVTWATRNAEEAEGGNAGNACWTGRHDQKPMGNQRGLIADLNTKHKTNSGSWIR